MFLDVYANEPASYGLGGSTNDTIFMDSDGKLYLGGGAARAENPSAGGVLRGTWDIGTPTGSGGSLTGLTVGQVAGAAAITSGSAATNLWAGTAVQFAALSITNPATVYFTW
jgi:hypothetical protein